MKFHNFIILILKTHFCKNHVSLFYFQKLQKSTKISKQREVLIKFKAINHITPEYNFLICLPTVMMQITKQGFIRQQPQLVKLT